MDFFLISWPNKKIGIAYPPTTFDAFAITETSHFEKWEPVACILKGGDFVDYTAMSPGLSLFSKKLRTIIDDNSSGEENIQWLEVTAARDTDVREYYMPHLEKRRDVLDPSRTVYADKERTNIMRPVFDIKKVGNLQLFSFPYGGDRFYITEKMKKAIQREKCTGIVFEKVESV